ncbi:MAG: Spo0B domain-containing protein [Clostridia bacterium]|nr:Spo0B domain-containing protein [Clostridia bacterium]
MRFKEMSFRHMDVNKASLYCMLINFMQILAGALLAMFILLDTNNTLTVFNEVLVLLLTGIACFGAVVDIREAMTARRMHVKMQGLNETVDQMSEMNVALRAQRHDFLNHLQVVYSLMEMEEYKDACGYIEQVYGDIRALSTSLRTANAPVNALLRAKMAECEQAGVALTLEVEGMWKDLPLPGWEMCRVLSNLIDNARDALTGNGSETMGKSAKTIKVHLGEDLKQFRFSVENNGPMIPEEFMRIMFEPGISQKGEGRGMGLHIARETLRLAGGDMTVESDEIRTVFSGFVPKNADAGALYEKMNKN